MFDRILYTNIAQTPLWQFLPEVMLLCAYAAAVYLFFDWVKLGKRSDRG
jgi:hypothetical protein